MHSEAEPNQQENWFARPFAAAKVWQPFNIYPGGNQRLGLGLEAWLRGQSL